MAKDNKTSQSVEDLSEWIPDRDASDFAAWSGLIEERMVAITKKYKRMEEALEKCTTLEGFGVNGMIIAKEALSYDPLSE